MPITVRVDVLDALDQMDELRDSTELKTKLLFSVMVVSGGLSRSKSVPSQTVLAPSCPDHAHVLTKHVAVN